MTELPEYVEIAGRLYEVVLVIGLIAHAGQLFRSFVFRDTQRVAISDVVSPEDRPALLERAVCAAEGLTVENFRRVPLVG